MKGYCKICGETIDEVTYSQFGCCEKCYGEIDKNEKRIKCIREHFCKAYQSNYDEGYGNCNVLSDCQDFHKEVIGEPEGLVLFPKKPDWEITEPLGELKEKKSLISRVAKISCLLFGILIIILVIAEGT